MSIKSALKFFGMTLAAYAVAVLLVTFIPVPAQLRNFLPK